MKYLALPILTLLCFFSVAPLAFAVQSGGGATATQCDPVAGTGCQAGFTCETTGDGTGACFQSGGGATNSNGSTVTGQSVQLLNPLKSGTSLESFLKNILDFMIRIGTIFIILMIVYIGFRFVAAQGEPGELQKAREMLMWTVVGALILLGAQAISSAIEATAKALGA
jgi:hypothetical protein